MFLAENPSAVVEQLTVDSPQQYSTSPVPSWDSTQLAKLQNVDVAIKRLIYYRTIGCKPLPREKKAETSKTKKLLNQWDCIVEKKGVLYCSNSNNHGNKWLQLLLPDSLHDELLKGVHDHVAIRDQSKQSSWYESAVGGLDYMTMLRSTCQNVNAVL